MGRIGPTPPQILQWPGDERASGTKRAAPRAPRVRFDTLPVGSLWYEYTIVLSYIETLTAVGRRMGWARPDGCADEPILRRSPCGRKL